MIETELLGKIKGYIHELNRQNMTAPRVKNNMEYVEYNFCLFKDEENPNFFVVVSNEDIYLGDKIEDSKLRAYVFDLEGNKVDYDISKLDLNWIISNCKSICNLI